MTNSSDPTNATAEYLENGYYDVDLQTGHLPLWLAVERSHMHVARELLAERGVEQLAYQNQVSLCLTSYGRNRRIRWLRDLHLFPFASALIVSFQ